MYIKSSWNFTYMKGLHSLVFRFNYFSLQDVDAFMKYRIKKSEDMNLPATFHCMCPQYVSYRLFPTDTNRIFFFYIFLNTSFQLTMGKMKNGMLVPQSH